ncbi:MAG: SsrA-binding protein SmpB [Chloroflexi bacterium]|nr:SsrA-binding protein SmpB [Chloroflexota bacterium]
MSGHNHQSHDGDDTIAVNRRAYHDYFIEDTFETGIVLTGTEIKSIRTGRVNLRDGYAQVRNGELWLYNVHIAPYEQGNRYNHEPKRDRKLLMHRQEIIALGSKVQRAGLTLVPLRLYLKHGRAKVALGLARGKRQYDKRESIAEREAQREIARAFAAHR